MQLLHSRNNNVETVVNRDASDCNGGGNNSGKAAGEIIRRGFTIAMVQSPTMVFIPFAGDQEPVAAPPSEPMWEWAKLAQILLDRNADYAVGQHYNCKRAYAIIY